MEQGEFLANLAFLVLLAVSGLGLML